MVGGVQISMVTEQQIAWSYIFILQSSIVMRILNSCKICEIWACDISLGNLLVYEDAWSSRWVPTFRINMYTASILTPDGSSETVVPTYNL